MYKSFKPFELIFSQLDQIKLGLNIRLAYKVIHLRVFSISCKLLFSTYFGLSPFVKIIFNFIQIPVSQNCVIQKMSVHGKEKFEHTIVVQI
jgi:hypothetical protein